MRQHQSAKQRILIPPCGGSNPPAPAISYWIGHSTLRRPDRETLASRTVGAVLQDIIRQKVAVTENGKTRRIPAIEVMFRRLANDAIRSDPRAMKLLLSLVDRYAETPETALKLGEVLAEDQAILAQYLQHDLQKPADCVPDRALRSDDGGHGDGV